MRLTKPWRCDLGVSQAPEGLRRRCQPHASRQQGASTTSLSLLAALPTPSVTAALRRDKYAAGQSWERNDLNDLVYLPVAAVFCHVVVMACPCIHRLGKANLPALYGTTLISDLRELTNVLVATAECRSTVW
jgi:hypothetical protein